MACQCGSTTPGDCKEAVPERGSETTDTQCIHAPGGEFDRQCDAVKPGADFYHSRGVCIRKLVAAKAGRSTIDEQLHGRKIKNLLGSHRNGRRREAQWRQTFE